MRQDMAATWRGIISPTVGAVARLRTVWLTAAVTGHPKAAE